MYVKCARIISTGVPLLSIYEKSLWHLKNEYNFHDYLMSKIFHCPLVYFFLSIFLLSKFRLTWKITTKFDYAIKLHRNILIFKSNRLIMYSILYSYTSNILIYDCLLCVKHEKWWRAVWLKGNGDKNKRLSQSTLFCQITLSKIAKSCVVNIDLIFYAYRRTL